MTHFLRYRFVAEVTFNLSVVTSLINIALLDIEHFNL